MAPFHAFDASKASTLDRWGQDRKGGYEVVREAEAEDGAAKNEFERRG